MNDRQRPYVAYLVRLWQVGAEVWRASATDPHTGEQRMFADVPSLCLFLHDATRRVDASAYSGPDRVDMNDGGDGTIE